MPSRVPASSPRQLARQLRSCKLPAKVFLGQGRRAGWVPLVVEQSPMCPVRTPRKLARHHRFPSVLDTLILPQPSPLARVHSQQCPCPDRPEDPEPATAWVHPTASPAPRHHRRRDFPHGEAVDGPLLSFSGPRSIFCSGSQRLSPKPLLSRRGVRTTPRRTFN